MATTVHFEERPKGLPYLLNKHAFSVQHELRTFGAPEDLTKRIIEIFRKGAEDVAEEAMKAVQIPALSKDARRDSEAYAEIIDNLREDGEMRKKRFIHGV